MNKKEKLKEISELDSSSLLGLYSKFVRVDHYDPFKTPAFAQELYDLNISLDEIESIVLQRMKPSETALQQKWENFCNEAPSYKYII